MAVEITTRQLEKIKEILRLDRNSDPEHVVDAALELLLQEQKLKHLQEIIGKADASLERGEGIKDSPEFWAGAKQLAKERAERGDPIDPDVMPS